MSATLAIARHELARLFVSPLAWSVLGAATALLAYAFLQGVEAYVDAAPRLAGELGAPGVTDLVVAPFFSVAAGLLVVVVPLVTMRAICEERRAGTLPLLYAAGADARAIVVGKWLGALGLLAALGAILAAMPAALAGATDLDWGKIAAGLLGLAALGAALAAVGVGASALAHHPATAAFGALAVSVLLWVLDGAARARGVTTELVNALAIPTHLSGFLRGLVASVDVAYFALLAGAALAVATWRVERLREDG
jgi:ABC-2 type transport system permease protein